jgi:hypothetical protein
MPVFRQLALLAVLMFSGCAVDDVRHGENSNLPMQSTAQWRSAVIDATKSIEVYCHKKGGTWIAPQIGSRNPRRFLKRTFIQYGPNKCLPKFDVLTIETSNGGSAPAGYSAFAEVYTVMDPVKGVTFEGSGLTMTFQSDLFTNFNGADFWLFVYDDHTGDVIQQYDLGVPTTDTLIVPSLFQGGFVIPHFNSGGPIGNTFQLAYTYGSALWSNKPISALPLGRARVPESDEGPVYGTREVSQ